MTEAEILLSVYKCIDFNEEDDDSCSGCPLKEAHVNLCRYHLKLALANIFFTSTINNISIGEEKG